MGVFQIFRSTLFFTPALKLLLMKKVFIQKLLQFKEWKHVFSDFILLSYQLFPDQNVKQLACAFIYDTSRFIHQCFYLTILQIYFIHNTSRFIHLCYLPDIVLVIHDPSRLIHLCYLPDIHDPSRFMHLCYLPTIVEDALSFMTPLD